MSRRGNCWDNAVVVDFLSLLKRERIRRKKYQTRDEAKRGVFALRRLRAITARRTDYIELFYTPQPKQVGSGMLSPITFEQQPKQNLQGVWQTKGPFNCTKGKRAP